MRNTRVMASRGKQMEKGRAGGPVMDPGPPYHPERSLEGFVRSLDHQGTGTLAALAIE